MRRIRTMMLLFAAAALAIPVIGQPSSTAPKKEPHQPTKARKPDLIVSSLKARMIETDKIEYSWVITNVGTGGANLDGPTSAQNDNVGVQAMLSKDTVYGNAGDLAAGGTIIGQSPLGMLPPGGAKSGSFRATVHGTPADHPYLILRVDVGNVVAELNEDNNLAVIGITN